jgi:AcrR family transcriptional regulator
VSAREPARLQQSARERILRAAVRLFQERSYHGVGLSEILTVFSVLALGFVPEAPELHATLTSIHARRQQLLERALREDGSDDARGLAALALAALDGGMIQAAAARDAASLRHAVERAARCLDVKQPD